MAGKSESDARIDRLERAIVRLGVDLAEFDDPEQAEARAKQHEADQKEAEKAAAAEAKAAEKAGA